MSIAPSVSVVAKERPPARAWLVVGLLCIVGCLNYLDRIMLTTMRESIVDAIPMTDAQFGLLTSAFLWIYGILSPLAGFFADRFKRSHVIIVSLFVWSLVTWLTGHATTFGQLLAARSLMGISEAFYLPAALALITDYHRGPTRSLAIGIHLAGILVGQSLGFLGGSIAENHGWSYSFGIFGIVGVAYAILLTFILREAPQQTTITTERKDTSIRLGAALKDLFSRRDYILLLVFYGLLGVVGWLIAGWLPTYYKEQFNLSQAEAGLYATGYLHPASLGGALLGGFLADRWSRTNPRARIILPAIGLCIAAPCVFFAAYSPLLPLAIVCFMVYGITRVSSDVNLTPITCMIVHPNYRATAIGVLNMFACIVGGIGLYAGGALRDANINLSLIFQVASATMLICAALLFITKAKDKSEP
jgi:MFS family permease